MQVLTREGGVVLCCAGDYTQSCASGGGVGPRGVGGWCQTPLPSRC